MLVAAALSIRNSPSVPSLSTPKASRAVERMMSSLWVVPKTWTWCFPVSMSRSFQRFGITE